LPIKGEDGLPRLERACVAGPVFASEQVAWAS
jgi:hypothetical protein